MPETIFFLFQKLKFFSAKQRMLPSSNQGVSQGQKKFSNHKKFLWKKNAFFLECNYIVLGFQEMLTIQKDEMKSKYFIFRITVVFFKYNLTLPLSCWNHKCSAFATSIEPGQLCTSVHSLTKLFTVGWPTSLSSHLDFPKNHNGHFQKCKVDYSI